MEGPSTHGGKDTNNKYCVYCTTPEGRLKSRADVRAGMIKYMIKTEKKGEEEARRLVEGHMKTMPAWKRK